MDLWYTHVWIGSKVGLEMSVGKAYYHSVYANVNSVSVHADLLRYSQARPSGLKRQTLTPKVIHFLNTGLFYGQSKVLNVDYEDDEDEPTFLVSTIEKLLTGFLPSFRNIMLGRFLAIHSEDIKSECEFVHHRFVRRKEVVDIKTRNLFIPASNGGMGITAPIDFKFRVSETQKLLNSRLNPVDNNYYYDTQGPLVGPRLFEKGTFTVSPNRQSQWDYRCIIPDHTFSAMVGGKKVHKWARKRMVIPTIRVDPMINTCGEVPAEQLLLLSDHLRSLIRD
jgi:hypothetical protein